MNNLAKRWPQLSLAFAGILMATVAHASLVWSSGTVAVTKVDFETDPTGTTSEGTLWLTFSSTPVATSCSAGGAGQWIVGGTTESIKSILATATAAKLSGNSVKVLYNNSNSGTQSCSGGGTTGVPILRGLELQ
jgi:hypothetical protein